MLASRHGRGTALQLAVDVPTYDAAVADKVPWLDIAGVHDADAGTLTFFAVNRHATEVMEAAIVLDRFSVKSVEHTLIAHDDLEATNTMQAPDNVAPKVGSGAALSSEGIALTLPPHSWSMVTARLGG
jgi:alpha-N-arabinofuranosidase